MRWNYLIKINYELEVKPGAEIYQSAKRQHEQEIYKLKGKMASMVVFLEGGGELFTKNIRRKPLKTLYNQIDRGRGFAPGLIMLSIIKSILKIHILSLLE